MGREAFASTLSRQFDQNANRRRGADVQTQNAIDVLVHASCLNANPSTLSMKRFDAVTINRVPRIPVNFEMRTDDAARSHRHHIIHIVDVDTGICKHGNGALNRINTSRRSDLSAGCR